MFGLLAIALVGIGVSACGSSISTSTGDKDTPTYSHATAIQRHAIGDKDKDPVGDNDSDNNNDNDNDSSSDYKISEDQQYYDHDDNSVVHYGHEATDADRQEIATLVKRYYAAAAAGNGAKACSMIQVSLAKAIPEDYGQPPGPAALRGLKTCAAIIGGLFKQRNRQLGVHVVHPVVTDVRVKGGSALVLLRFGTTPEPRQMSVDREGKAWKIQSLVDTEFL